MINVSIIFRKKIESLNLFMKKMTRWTIHNTFGLRIRC